jgi:hypothetical protein
MCAGTGVRAATGPVMAVADPAAGPAADPRGPDADPGTDPVTDPATDPADTLYIAERLLSTARDDLARADTKAAVLLSGAFAVPALLLGGRTGTLDGWGPWPALLALGALLWACGTALLIWALLPRTGTARAGPGLTFFADARAAPDRHRLVLAAGEAGRDRVGWLMTQFVDVSMILTAKYRCLRWGVCSLAPGLLFGILSLTAG